MLEGNSMHMHFFFYLCMHTYINARADTHMYVYECVCTSVLHALVGTVLLTKRNDRDLFNFVSSNLMYSKYECEICSHAS